ncbi:hypothetical protein Sango_2124900 [Sesamum angolense]|uniref:Reverse transcriptase zinc-binding domain-containing protein n=1 Tax=Sesamum angolense TaxID=2727404 RepID=A0AAE1WCE3_9LAMI|nr:hypothetical protein Sango_2124900 [Sesamum angolense]
MINIWAFRRWWEGQIAVFGGIKERIWKKLRGWSMKRSSQVRRMVMIKLVIQVISTYTMSCFNIPEVLLSETESMIAAFFWHQDRDRKIYWMVWNTLCQREQDGDLGIHHLKEFNTALLCKQAWRMVLAPSSLLRRVYKHKYLVDDSFLTAAGSTTLICLAFATVDLTVGSSKGAVRNWLGRTVRIVENPMFRPVLHAPRTLLPNEGSWDIDRILGRRCGVDLTYEVWARGRRLFVLAIFFLRDNYIRSPSLKFSVVTCRSIMV